MKKEDILVAVVVVGGVETVDTAVLTAPRLGFLGSGAVDKLLRRGGVSC